MIKIKNFDLSFRKSWGYIGPTRNKVKFAPYCLVQMVKTKFKRNPFRIFGDETWEQTQIRPAHNALSLQNS